MNMQAMEFTRAEARRLFGDLTTDITKMPAPAMELEGHLLGILSRHGNVRKVTSTGQGIIVVEDEAHRVFKVEISQVAGPA